MLSPSKGRVTCVIEHCNQLERQLHAITSMEVVRNIDCHLNIKGIMNE